MKKQIYSILAVAIMGGGILTGCGTPKSDEELAQVESTIENYGTASSEDSILGLESILAKNLKYFESAEVRDKLISTYMQKLYGYVSELDSKLGVVGYELEYLVSEYGVDPSNPMTYRKIPKTSQTVRGFLEEVQAEGFELGYNYELMRYVINIDTQLVVDKFGQYASDSMLSYLEFTAYEASAPAIIDAEEEVVNIEEVANRIIQIEQGIELSAVADYANIDLWVEAGFYYYPILFGLTHELYLNEDGYVNASVVEELKTIAVKYKDTPLAEKIEEGVAILEDAKLNMSNAVTEKLGAVVDSFVTEEIQVAIDKLNESVEDGDSEETEVGTEDTGTGTTEEPTE